MSSATRKRVAAKLFHRSFVGLLLWTTFVFGTDRLRAQGTGFTYHGLLGDGAGAANGSYELAFILRTNAGSGGNQVGPGLTNAATVVSNGLFTATLDFGGVFDGSPRFLEIYVRTNGSADFTQLSPRQPITPTPHAIFAQNSAQAQNALTAESVAWSAITGIPLGDTPDVIGANGTNNSAMISNSIPQTLTGAVTGTRDGTSFATTYAGTVPVANGGRGVNTVPGFLDMNAQTGLVGIAARNASAPQAIGQLAWSNYGPGNCSFWQANGMSTGNWDLLFSIGAGGMAFGDPTLMRNTGYGNTRFWVMGNPHLQTAANASSDSTLNFIDTCPYNSGGGVGFAMVTTNNAQSLYPRWTNANNEVIGVHDELFAQILAVPQQGPIYDLPGYLLIVQNGNESMAIASSMRVDNVIGNYAHFMTDPASGNDYFPMWQGNVFTPTNAAWRSALKVNHYDGKVAVYSNLTVQGSIIAGLGYGQYVTTPAGKLVTSQLDPSDNATINKVVAANSAGGTSVAGGANFLELTGNGTGITSVGYALQIREGGTVMMDFADAKTSARIFPGVSLGVGGTPDPSAKLDIQSITQGALLPRMTKDQRNAIASPATGLAVYQTDNMPGLRVYNGAGWMRYSETTD
jgi:hypothetical protein